jgi:membrane protease subunit (stomatin/prohibitin family)
MDTFDAEQAVVSQLKPEKKDSKSHQPLDLLRWVGLIDRLESGARYLFLGMAMMSFVAYGYMVYTQDQWQTNHRQLQKLRNQESQQAIINARLRNQAAELAEKDSSGTIDPSPGRAVFVPITDVAAPNNKSDSRKPAPISPEISITVGY